MKGKYLFLGIRKMVYGGALTLTREFLSVLKFYGGTEKKSVAGYVGDIGVVNMAELIMLATLNIELMSVDFFTLCDFFYISPIK